MKTDRRGHARWLRVADAGLLSTVQDRGRRHAGSMGVSPSGALDWFSASAANRLVGNPAAAALIETTLAGIALSFESDARVAVTGAQAIVSIGGLARDVWRSNDVRAGETLVIGPATRGARSYVAVDGGIQVPRVLESASTDVGAGFGGFRGRRFEAGDRIELAPGAGRDPAIPHLALRPSDIPLWSSRTTLAALLGPHAEALSARAMALLCEREFRVTHASNRQAIRFEGQPLDAAPADVVSCGVCAGCVQITSDGLPLALLAEHQTTGGYAVALCVTTAELPRAAQLRPGDSVHFVRSTHADARASLDALARRLRQVVETTDAAALAAGFFEGA